MNILLISVQRNLDIIGLKGLHHLLLARGWQSFLLYLPRFDPFSPGDNAALAGFVRQLNPAFIGISLMAIDYSVAKHVSRALKQVFPEIPLIWGGIHATTAPEMCLEDADYVCIGEGEQTVLDLAEAAQQGRTFRDVKNLCFLENGALRRNPLYPLVMDLDELPISRQIPENSFVLLKGEVHPLVSGHLSRFRRYRGGVYKILSSRGCPYACAYCVNNFLKTLYARNPIRRRSIGHVMHELETAMKEGPRLTYVDITDDCFLACTTEYLESFCREYKTRINLPFIVKGTPRYFTPEKMDLLVDAGLAWANIGLQSGSDRICKEVYLRQTSAADFLEAARLIHRYPVAAYYDVIVDNFFESLEDELKTVETLTETPRPFYLEMFSLTLYHGTQLYERAKNECPDRIKPAVDRDYYFREKRDANVLIEIAGLLHRPLMRRLIARFRRAPNAPTSRLALRLAAFYAKTFLRPIAYFRLIRRSLQGSFWRACAAMPLYLSEGAIRYLKTKGWVKAPAGKR